MCKQLIVNCILVKESFQKRLLNEATCPTGSINAESIESIENRYDCYILSRARSAMFFNSCFALHSKGRTPMTSCVNVPNLQKPMNMCCAICVRSWAFFTGANRKSHCKFQQQAPPNTNNCSTVVQPFNNLSEWGAQFEKFTWLCQFASKAHMIKAIHKQTNKVMKIADEHGCQSSKRKKWAIRKMEKSWAHTIDTTMVLWTCSPNFLYWNLLCIIPYRANNQRKRYTRGLEI